MYGPTGLTTDCLQYVVFKKISGYFDFSFFANSKREYFTTVFRIYFRS